MNVISLCCLYTTTKNQKHKGVVSFCNRITDASVVKRDPVRKRGFWVWMIGVEILGPPSLRGGHRGDGFVRFLFHD